MDPDAALNEIRAILRDIELDGGDATGAARAARLAEVVHGLDEWMSRGGLAPQAWTSRQPKPEQAGSGKNQIQKYAGGMNLKVGMRASEYGTPRPVIELRAQKGMSHRLVNALLHQIAAATEMATAITENWIVQIEQLNNGGRVYLELAKGDAAEADRGIAMLVQVVRTAQ